MAISVQPMVTWILALLLWARCPALAEELFSNQALSTPISPVLPDESVEAMAAVSGSGAGGTGSVVAETSSSGFSINLVFDAAAMAAPASFRIRY